MEDKVAKGNIIVENNGSIKELYETVGRDTIPAIFKELKLDIVVW